MDIVQRHNSFTNVPSSQTFRSYSVCSVRWVVVSMATRCKTNLTYCGTIWGQQQTEIGWTPGPVWTTWRGKILDPTGTRTPNPRSSSPYPVANPTEVSRLLIWSTAGSINCCHILLFYVPSLVKAVVTARMRYLFCVRPYTAKTHIEDEF
jgi:hypothetical protein